MVKNKARRSEFESDLAKLRDQILLLASTGDVSSATLALGTAKDLVAKSEAPEDVLREARCRLLESELHILGNTRGSTSDLLDCLLRISKAADFSPERRKFVLEMGIEELKRVI